VGSSANKKASASSSHKSTWQKKVDKRMAFVEKTGTRLQRRAATSR
jgi:hypothetical protein